MFILQIILAGISLPWLGFIFGYIAAVICRQSKPDIRAISLETGIQNTGIAIFLLSIALPQPAADLTTGKESFCSSINSFNLAFQEEVIYNSFLGNSQL